MRALVPAVLLVIAAFAAGRDSVRFADLIETFGIAHRTAQRMFRRLERHFGIPAEADTRGVKVLRLRDARVAPAQFREAA